MQYEFWTVAVTLPKLSLLMLYRRLFPVRQTKILTLIIGIACVVWMATQLLVLNLQCIPIQKSWDYTDAGSCFSIEDNAMVSLQVINCVLDITVMLAPMPQIKRLHLPHHKKVGLFYVFATGILSVPLDSLLMEMWLISDIHRTFAMALTRLGTIANIRTKVDQYKMDATWFTANISFCAIEPAMSCFASSMPTFWPVVRAVLRIPRCVEAMFTAGRPIECAFMRRVFSDEAQPRVGTVQANQNPEMRDSRWHDKIKVMLVKRLNMSDEEQGPQNPIAGQEVSSIR